MNVYPIGKILKEIGVLGDAQLEAALHVQKASQLKIGEILINLNFISEKELSVALARQLNLEYIDIDEYTPEIHGLEQIDAEFAKINNLLPILLENNTLYIATSNPDEDMKKYLQEITEKEIVFKVSSRDKTQQAIQVYYEELDQPIESIINDLISSIKDDGDDVDMIQLVDFIINHAIIERATDIHISPEAFTVHIFYRIDGVMRHFYALPLKYHHILSTRLKVLSKLDIAKSVNFQNGEFRYSFTEINYNIRISIIPTIHGEKIALRIHPEYFSLHTPKGLGFEDDLIEKLDRFIEKKNGMLLIVGPSGSGKSTTLFSMLRKVNILERNVISIEEPVEFQLPFINQIEVNPKIGLTYEESIRHIARQDPDVIVIGEILDELTSKLTIQTSMTGHLILTTMFGKQPTSVISRLTDFNVERYSLAEGLTAILSQKLVRRLCPHCKELTEVTVQDIDKAFQGDLSQKLEEKIYKIYKPKGCIHCNNVGFHGRVALAEFLEIDDNIKKMIQNDRSSLSFEKYIRENNIKTIKDDALIKVLNGITSLEEIQHI